MSNTNLDPGPEALTGITHNPNASGVLGVNTAGGIGVNGTSDFDLGTGVHGENVGGNVGPDRGVGVWGESRDGFGVFGSSSNHQGVRGFSKIGVGVNGINGKPAQLQPGVECGVHGESRTGICVCGISDGGPGVKGVTSNGKESGVVGENRSAGSGVFGNSVFGAGVFGASQEAVGVLGTGKKDAAGVRGESDTGPGVSGKCQRIDSDLTDLDIPGISDSTGVLGTGPIGVKGDCGENGGIAGLVGINHSGTGVWCDGNPALSVRSATGDLIVGKSLPGIPNTAQDYRIVFRVDHSGRIHAGGGDIAERIAVSGAAACGDVVEIDPDYPGQFRVATTANSTAVAGVISTKPGVTLNGQDIGDLEAHAFPQLALAGRVAVKASAENGPLRPGDLLVASSTPGHAMRAQASPRPGTIIGKALDGLERGKGVIEMLVMLR